MECDFVGGDFDWKIAPNRPKSPVFAPAVAPRAAPRPHGGAILPHIDSNPAPPPCALGAPPPREDALSRRDGARGSRRAAVALRARRAQKE